jgi:hypothetical protein
MATMSPSTFNPLHAYVNVRLQQGVPIVDSDLNELDDVRKFELRAFLKWFVGDGVPAGNDGFRIGGGLDNDVTISAGVPAGAADAEPEDTALRHVGRLLVDGVDVIIKKDVRYSGQPLHASQPGAAELAAKLRVPVAPALAESASDATLVAYLDVWERLLSPADEPDLVHAGLGVETCARMVRDWVVRIGAVLPAPGTAGFLVGHLYYPLAAITRRANTAAIAVTDVRDLRERGLLVPPAHLITDLLGIEAPKYRRGEGRPVVNLREAINALLVGQLPTTAELSVSPAPGPDVFRRGSVVDEAGGLVAVWQSARSGGSNQIVASRLNPLRVEDGFADAVLVTSGVAHVAPTVVALPGGDLLVAYQNGLVDAPSTDVLMKRGRLGALAAATERSVAATTNAADQGPLAVLANDVVVIFTQQVPAATPADNQWTYRRYRHTDNTFLDASPVRLSTDPVQPDLHAMAAGDKVWVAYSDGSKLEVLRLDTTKPPGTAVENRKSFTGLSGTLDVFVLAINADSAVVFFDKGPALQSVTFAGGSWGDPVGVTGTDPNDSGAAAVVDADGTVYLASARTVTGASSDIILRRRNAVTGDWTSPQRLTTDPSSDQRPHPVLVPGSGIWVLWMSNRNNNQFDVFAKRVITAI